MNAAYKIVKSNKGSGGIDGMSTEALLAYLKKHGSEFIASLLEGTYKPNPVRRVEIPKALYSKPSVRCLRCFMNLSSAR